MNNSDITIDGISVLESDVKETKQYILVFSVSNVPKFCIIGHNESLYSRVCKTFIINKILKEIIKNIS